MFIIIVSILAGICGMGLGGLLTAIWGALTEKMTSIFLSFAGGVMTSIVFFELIPEAYEHSNTVIILIGLTLGVLVVSGLSYIINKVSSPHVYSGMLVFFVICLHNISEGVIIGMAGNYDFALCITLAIMVGIHNIPQGMATSAALISGGLNRWKAVLLTLSAGATTVIGALAGVLIGEISDVILALSFSLAGGAMLFVVFGDILPQSMKMSKDRIPAAVMLAGIALGLILTKI